MFIIKNKATGLPYTLTFVSHNTTEIPEFETRRGAKSFMRARRLTKTGFAVVEKPNE